MARKRTLGYVQLEWTCPNCNSRNPGGLKTCQNCGAPQPENVRFERAAEEKLETEEKAIQAAATGADIHCGFCGTRNPATATVCSQCGADLTEGKARAAGGELKTAPAVVTVLCTNCGERNPASRTMCGKCGAPLPRAQSENAAVDFSAPMGGSPDVVPTPLAAKTARPVNKLLLAGIGIALLVCCVAGIFLFAVPSSSVQGTVIDVYWQTAVPLQEKQEVQYSNEQGDPPAGAYDVSCYTDTRQVCEQKTIDRGNGYAEVVEECHDESTDYCSYSVQEWKTIQTFTEEGHDLFPVYASPDVSLVQRAGSASEDLSVVFYTDKGEITYSPDTVQEFQQFQIGSEWTMKLNSLGGVLDVEP